MRESWKPIRGYDGYEVSDQGRVRSLERWCGVRTVPARILKPEPNVRDGHLRVRLYDGRGVRHSRRFQVHVLVLEAFVGPRPDGMFGCHWNGIPDDNRLDNLRWDTAEGNEADTQRHGSRRQARCRNGHLYLGENLAFHAQGWQRCRTCTSAKNRRYRKARR